VPISRLLDDEPWEQDPDGAWVAERGRAEAADLQARLRGVTLGGSALTVRVQPPPRRPEVRRARTEDARRRRDTTPGFTRPGARLDDAGRRFLTPEALALALGRRVAGQRVVDATAGCGGNAIGFARAKCRVTAIEPDAARLAMAAHNAGIYGVCDRIRFVRGTAQAHLQDLSADLLFIDPPWDDLGVLDALLEHADRFAQTWAKVPPTLDPARVPGSRAEAWFGHRDGDRRRVKFLLLTRGAANEGG